MAAAAADAAEAADLAECRELQEQEVESLRLIFPMDDDGGGEGGDGNAAAGAAVIGQESCSGTRLLACAKQDDGGWTLRLDVEATVPPPAAPGCSNGGSNANGNGGIDIVVAGAGAAEADGERDDAPPALRSVKYLPPIQLQLHLGPSYPLHAAPAFVSLWAPWLDARGAAWVRGEMGRMWEEVYQGGPVVFSWVEWLQHEMVEGLLGAVGGGGEEGWRLTLEGPPPAAAVKEEEEEEGGGEGEVDDDGWGPRLLQVLAYTYARESEAFARGTHTCFICFDSKPGRLFATLACGHYWCRECLGEMARTHVRDGDVGALVCPHPECGEGLGPDVLKELLPPEAFDRWERLLLSKTLDGMEDVAYCPRDQTPTIVDGGLGECPTCHFAFCARCKEAYHGSAAQCWTGEARLKQVEAEIKRIMDRGGTLTATQNAKLEKLRRAAEESLSRRAVEKGSRACPKCAMRVEKAEGCNKMRCRCGVLWCWKCGKDISEESYGHFREGASNCGLWEQEALLAWQRQMLQMEAHRGIQGEMVRLVNWGRWGGGAPEDGAWRRRGRRAGGGGQEGDGIRIVRCGKCGGQHVKLNSNNHIRCDACRGQFCALCGASNFKKASEHFGPGGCKQHS